MRLDFSIPGKGILGQGRRQAADCILILLEHRPVINQDFFFKLAQVFQLNRCGSPGQHVQDIHASLCHTRQVVSLGRTPTTLVFTLCVGFNPSDFTKKFLRQAQSLSLALNANRFHSFGRMTLFGTPQEVTHSSLRQANLNDLNYARNPYCCTSQGLTGTSRKVS